VGELGTGTATICLVVGPLFVDSPVVSQPLTVSPLTIITMSTIGGALVGVAVESQRSKRQMEIRHSVLDRILRHNLRNDMNVVLANLKTAKSRVDGPERGQLTTVERKIEQLLDLVDNIRRVDTSFGTRSCVPVRIELVSLLETRVADLRQSHPDLELSTDFPDQAWVYAEEQFPLVIDNFVQSAIMYSTEAPSLHVEVTVAEEVVLRLDDVGHTIPDPDLSALTTGQEGRLTHGRGVELWLATWLTERSDGEMTIDAEGDSRSITVTLTRASEG
jgi:signal transduction histidine kinase